MSTGDGTGDSRARWSDRHPLAFVALVVVAVMAVLCAAVLLVVVLTFDISMN